MILKNIATVALIIGGALLACLSHFIIGGVLIVAGIVIALTTYKK